MVRLDDHLYEELKRLKKENARLTEEHDLLKKQRRTLRLAQDRLCQGTTVKYVWIKQHDTEFSVKSMCWFMSVSRSAYYAWLLRPQTAIENR